MSGLTIIIPGLSSCGDLLLFWYLPGLLNILLHHWRLIRICFQTPLHICAEHGFVDNIVLLVQYGADLMAKDSNGFTALDVAEKSEHEETMGILKKAAGNFLNCHILFRLILFVYCWLSHKLFANKNFSYCYFQLFIFLLIFCPEKGIFVCSWQLL